MSRARTATASPSISTPPFSDYWYWRPHDGAIVYRNRMPEEIVAIFEKHGFIWGGKWYHFDTMHFEFRPELLVDEVRREFAFAAAHGLGHVLAHPVR